MNWRIKILNYISSAFKDDNGNTSLMRWLAVLCVVSGIVFAFVKAQNAVDYAFVTSLVTLGMGAKYMQKKVEKK